MSTLATIHKPNETDLAALSVASLKEELRSALASTVATLWRLAAIVRELESRGEDLSDLRLGLLSYLRRIGSGQLRPELVVRFACSPLILQRAALLPITDQDRLARCDSLPFAVWSEGKIDHRQVDPRLLSRGQLSQLLGPEGIRELPDQVLFLESRGQPEPTKTKAKPSRIGKVKPDPKRGGLVVGRTFASAVDVVAGLAALAGDDAPDGERSETVATKLTESEKIALDVAASRSQVPTSILIRRALLACGLLASD